MRILLVSHHAPPHIGGVENLVLMEAEAFLAEGHEVVWITSDGTGDGEAPPQRPGLTIRRVWALHLVERLFGIAYPLFAPTLLWWLWRAVGKADLVHVHGLVFPGSPVAALFARMRGKKAVCTDHGGMLEYDSRLASFAMWLLMATLGRITARCCHKLVPYNHDVEELLVRLSGRRDKVQFVANPIDVARFQPPTAEQKQRARQELGWDDRPRALLVSRLLPHKGIDILLAARDASFEVAFCGPGEESMRTHIREQGGECLAPRPHEAMLTLYHAADVFVLPSHNEGFPVAIQEALACGLPVVTTDMPAYDAYRSTPGLHLCEATPEVVRQHILAALGTCTQRPSTQRPSTQQPSHEDSTEAAAKGERSPHAAWLAELCDVQPRSEGAG